MTNGIPKEMTNVLKGIAILFMILHHGLIVDFYIKRPNILETLPLIKLMIGMKMCVGIYTFIIGYGF